MNDTERCAYCPLCPSGQYWKTGCDGSSFSSERNCQPCDRCGENQFVASFQGCLGHRTSRVKYVCSNCTTCNPNYQHGPDCDGTTAIDTPCVICPSCSAGQYISMDPITKSCNCTRCRTACNVGEYQSGIGCSRGTSQKDDFCLPCATASTCDQKTQYISDVCDGKGTVDVQQCQNCSSSICDQVSGIRYYNDVASCSATAPTYSWCKPCKRCTQGFNTGTPCTGSVDSVCTPCLPSNCGVGRFEQTACMLQLAAQCATCTFCGVNRYDASPNRCSDGLTDRGCTECTQSCQPDYELVIPCTDERDAVCAPSLGKCV